jgi:hypothetical protein
MQIHFYFFVGGGKKWRLYNTTHVTENFSSHWLILYTNALINKISKDKLLTESSVYVYSSCISQ